MPDLTSASPLADNYEQVVAANGLGPKTLIVSITDSGDAVANDDLVSIINYMTSSHGSAGTGDSAFSVAGISGVPGTDQVIYVALQGTGTLTVADADMGVANTAVAIVATFDQ